jgi:hypothetical protein
MIPFLLMFHGWAVKTVWNWFVPAILGWPRLGIAQAIGLSIVVSVARPRTPDHQDETPTQMWVRTFTNVITVLLSVGIGWIVHEVMA